VVVFPHMVIPLFVGRPKSIKALETAMEAGKSILLVAQKVRGQGRAGPPRTCTIGCLANILQMLKLPDGTVKVLVEGVQRARVCASRTSALFVADVSLMPIEERTDNEVEAMRRTVLAQFDQYVKLNKKIPPEILTSLAGIEEPAAWPTPSPPTCR
jgi:ATP-dependent Lon protease